MLRGFSFIEVLFALAVLAVGFIMIAAIFPVAIRQTDATVDATTAQTVADHATQSLLAVSTSQDFPDTNGRISRIPAPVIQRLAGSMIYPTDPRYAFSGVYERAGASDPIVYFYILRSREDSGFEPAKVVAMEEAPSEPPDMTNPPPQVDIQNDIVYNGVTYDGILASDITSAVLSRCGGTGATASGMTARALLSSGELSDVPLVLGRRARVGASDFYLLPSTTVTGPAGGSVSARLFFFPGEVTAFEPRQMPVSIQYGQPIGDYPDVVPETEANTIEFFDDLGKQLARPGLTVLLADNNPKAMYYVNNTTPGNGFRAPNPEAAAENARRGARPLANGTIVRLGARVSVSSASRAVYEIQSITDASGNLIEMTGPIQNVEPYDGTAGIDTSPSAADPELPRAFVLGPRTEKPWLSWDNTANKFSETAPLELAVLRVQLKGLK